MSGMNKHAIKALTDALEHASVDLAFMNENVSRQRAALAEGERALAETQARHDALQSALQSTLQEVGGAE